MKKNIILLGGSTFLIQNGFSSVFDVNKFNLFNLSLGGTTSIQLLYELKKEKNYLLFKNADLIIVNSNVNEIQSCANKYENLSLELIYRDMELLFLELNKLNKKILVLILPFFFYNDIVNKVNSIVRYLTKKYFFNLIDMQRYYEKHNLEDIAKAWDGSHQFNFITKKLAFEISNQIKNFRKPIQLNTYPEIDFKICYFDEYKKFIIQNSLMSEQYSRIKSGDKIKFEEMYYGYKILAIHTWNNTDNTDMNNMKKDWNMLTHTISPIVLQNKKIRISKPTNFMNMVVSIQNKIYIDKYTIIKYSNKDQFDEFYHNARTWESFNIAKHLDLISVFLIKGELVQDDLNNIYTNNSEISEYYNFSRLIPPVEWYKEIINEYCLVLDPRKKAPLYNQIATLNNEKQKLIDEKSNLQAQINQLESILNSLSIKKQQLEISNLEQDLINKKLQTKQLETQLNIASNKKIARDIQLVTIGKNSAKTRIQNQLSYKLGQAMIVNSKSLLGYIRMPFALSYIKDKHKQEQKIYQEKIKKDPSLKLPPLETYPDYQEALKEKECFTYKLGEALIKANKTWYKGGYLKFYFKDIPKLKRDFRQKR